MQRSSSLEGRSGQGGWELVGALGTEPLTLLSHYEKWSIHNRSQSVTGAWQCPSPTGSLQSWGPVLFAICDNHHTDKLCKAPWILGSYSIMPPSLAFSPQLQSMVQRDGCNSSLKRHWHWIEVKVTESSKSPEIYKDFPKDLLTPNSLYSTRI